MPNRVKLFPIYAPCSMLRALIRTSLALMMTAIASSTAIASEPAQLQLPASGSASIDSFGGMIWRPDPVIVSIESSNSAQTAYLFWRLDEYVDRLLKAKQITLRLQAQALEFSQVPITLIIVENPPKGDVTHETYYQLQGLSVGIINPSTLFPDKPLSFDITQQLQTSLRAGKLQSDYVKLILVARPQPNNPGKTSRIAIAVNQAAIEIR